MGPNDRGRQFAPSRSRSALATYTPLILTLTIAGAGALAYLWTHGADDDEEAEPGLYRRTARDDRTAPPGYESRGAGEDAAQEGSLVARVSGAVSSSGMWDGAGRMAAAAGSALGLTSREGTELGEADDDGRRREKGRGKKIAREAREEGFSDHERWSEEAAALRKTDPRTAALEAHPGTKKRVVAVVVSAEHSRTRTGDTVGVEHASILSHLPSLADSASTTLYILIFAPSLASSSQPTGPSSSAGNSYYASLHSHAMSLVSHPTHVLPFTTATGYVHILRHLAPALAYVSDTPSLSGAGGENMAALKGWVGQTVVVVGDEDGVGGLVDTETETEGEHDERKPRGWWEDSEMVGLGKGTEVVDVARLGDDWGRRVGVSGSGRG